MVRTERHADACRQEHLLLLQVEGSADLREDDARQVRDRPAVVDVARQVLQEQRELVAGQAPDHRLPRQRARQALGEDFQRAIARRVSERVVHFLEVIHVQVEQRDGGPGTGGARQRLLQQVLELHPVRNLGEGVVAREIADAPLGPLALGDVAGNEDVALELRILGRDLRAGEGNRDRLSAARADHRLARILGRLRDREGGAFLLLEHEQDRLSDQLLLAVAEQLAGRVVGALDRAVRRSHQHGIVHAVQNDVQVVLGDGRLPQLQAHALQRELQLTDLVLARDGQRTRVVALPDTVRALDELRDRPLDTARQQPGRHQPGHHQDAAREREQRDELDEVPPLGIRDIAFQLTQRALDTGARNAQRDGSDTARAARDGGRNDVTRDGERRGLAFRGTHVREHVGPGEVANHDAVDAGLAHQATGNCVGFAPIAPRHCIRELLSTGLDESVRLELQLRVQLLLDRAERERTEPRGIELVLPEQETGEQQGDGRSDGQCGERVLDLQAVRGHATRRSPEDRRQPALAALPSSH